MKQPAVSAPALARGILLLDQLAVDGQASLEKLAARNQWPKSSVLRCLQTLEQAGAVEQHPETKHWRALKQLQPLISPALEPMQQARNFLPGLAQGTGHCAELYAWQQGILELIDRAEPDFGDLLVRARIGSRRDLEELDATALILFAFAPDSQPPERVWVWKKGKKKSLSAEKRELRIAECRHQGWAVDQDFNENGIRRFAIPVWAQDRLTGVLAVAQRQTPAADRETDFILKTLLPSKSL
ncbi:MAG: helix-turn-helix domain-containing protein [Kiritimatiellia bacterium]